MKISERRAEISGAEVGPERVDEAELGVGAFPEQEVGQPLLAAGADQEIDVRNWGLTPIRNFVRNWGLTPILQQAAELLARGRALLAPRRRCVGDRVAG